MDPLVIPLISGGLAGAVVTAPIKLGGVIVDHYRRPILRLGPFEKRAPFFRLAPEGDKDITAYYVNIPLTNVGHRLARRCQPIVTAWGQADANGNWSREKNWVPVGLRWALDEWELRATRKPLYEPDLIPEPASKTKKSASVPRYLFNLGKISENHPGEFDLQLLIRPKAQRSRFPPGRYCFQVTAFAQDADWDEKWYCIKWVGGVTEESLTITELDEAPWRG